jgi:hypothetical protein
MEFYLFVRDFLAWTASVACLFPVNVPFLFFAHRIREGHPTNEDDRMDSDEAWKRASLGALVLALMTAVFFFVDVVFATWADMPPGIVHFIVLLAYIPAAAYVLAMFFAYDDYFNGLGLLTLYLGLPLAVLFLVNWPTELWKPVVGFFASFLKEIPKST